MVDIVKLYNFFVNYRHISEGNVGTDVISGTFLGTPNKIATFLHGDPYVNKLKNCVDWYIFKISEAILFDFGKLYLEAVTQSEPFMKYLQVNGAI